MVMSVKRNTVNEININYSYQGALISCFYVYVQMLMDDFIYFLFSHKTFFVEFSQKNFFFFEKPRNFYVFFMCLDPGDHFTKSRPASKPIEFQF